MIVAPSKSSAFCGKALRAVGPTRVQAARPVAAQAAVNVGTRPVWFPGNPPPSYLDGSLPGDFGFDPLGLGSDPQLLKWFQQSELVHSRTAMTAAAGILFTSIAHKLGADIPEWYDAGRVYAEQHPDVSQTGLLFAEFALCGFVEIKRWEDFKNPGSQGDGSFFGITDGLKGTSNGYPGGVFDPFGFSKGDKKIYEKYQWNEIRNGRLAMVALVGFVVQHIAYPGKGPIDNLVDHVSSPTSVTFATNGVSLPFLLPSWTQ